MTTEELNNQFNEAFLKASSLDVAVSSEVMLKLYAYYKQAVYGDEIYCKVKDDTRNDFKTNAWMQLKGMKESKAKQEYINLVNSILKQS